MVDFCSKLFPTLDLRSNLIEADRVGADLGVSRHARMVQRFDDEHDLVLFRTLAKIHLFRFTKGWFELASTEDAIVSEVFSAMDENDDGTLSSGEIQR